MGKHLPTNGEIIERLSRENERQGFEIERLKARIDELEAELAKVKPS